MLVRTFGLLKLSEAPFTTQDASRKDTRPPGSLRTKKAALLALYRAHPDYGDRSRASRVAAELAAQAGLQAGTAQIGRAHV